MASLAKYQGELNLADEGFEIVKMVYDFSVDGGAVSFLQGCQAGQQLVVNKAYMKVQTTCTSGGSATVSVGQTGGVASLVAATAVASLTAGAVIAGVAATGAGGIKIAAADYLGLDIAVAALTAGKIEVVLVCDKF